jgi:hypothetical protein
MSQRVAWRVGARLVVMLLGLAAILAACAKDPVRVDRNRPPRTFLVAAPPESGSFSYRIHLYWRGEDPDGFISGFLWSWDDSSVNAFRFTTKTDSIFELTVNDSATIAGAPTNTPPGTSRAHTFFIRAVDNLGKPDPGLIVFNRRIINSTTERPTIEFRGAYPSQTVVDTLCDGQPFEVCWSGQDPDGRVIGYRFDVGSYSSPIVTDSCFSFNDPGNPNSIPLSSGTYTFTVQAVDNAYALSDPGASKFFFVVNRDPVTWFEDASGGRGIPVGYYIRPFLRGQQVPPVPVPFAPGDTIPYRSTVWWHWDGQDNACDTPSGIEAFSLSPSQILRNDGDPYIVGFIDELAPGVPFTTNDPVVMNQLGFSHLIAESLDAGLNMSIVVRARDVSGRISDRTYAGEFTFSCNRPPVVTGFTVGDTCVTIQGQPGFQKAKVFRWTAEDDEDGFPPDARISLENGLEDRASTRNTNFSIISERTFRDFSNTNPHVAEVRVIDRAGYTSTNRIRITFDVNYADTTCVP